MSDSAKIMGCLLSSLLLCSGAEAIVADSANPYQGIVDRNVFGLKPPPPPSKEGEGQKKPDPPEITLTGITTIFGDKRALLNVKMPAKPPEPAKLESLIIPEGQRHGDIEVLEINEKTGDVKINDFGTVITKNLDKDGPKLTASAAPVAGVAPNTPGYVPPPPSFPSGNVTVPTPNGIKTIPTRTLRTTPATAAPGASVNPGPLNLGAGVVNPGMVNPGMAQAAPAPAINADEQAMNMLLQHVDHTGKGIEMPPLLPPLAEVLNESTPGAQQNPSANAPANNNTFQVPRIPGQPAVPPAFPRTQ